MEKTANQNVPAFGYELLRDHVMASILGKHEQSILYWAGKELARKFPLFSMTEAPVFFAEAGWGNLQLVKENKDEMIFELSSNELPLHIKSRCFRLEAGFLAAQQERNCGFLTECYDEKNSKQDIITFTLKTDYKEPIAK